MRRPEEKIIDIEEAYRISREIRAKGKKIAFTNGCFDIIHMGHISTFIEAKKHAEFLFVGINTDDSIKRLKGERRPIIPLGMRMYVVAACEAVDYVIPFSDDTPYKIIALLEPDVLVKGEDWPEESIVGADIVKSKGGKVLRVKLVEGISTSEIINKILRIYKEG